jgi:hypothetical protein
VGCGQARILGGDKLFLTFEGKDVRLKNSTAPNLKSSKNVFCIAKYEI